MCAGAVAPAAAEGLAEDGAAGAPAGLVAPAAGGSAARGAVAALDGALPCVEAARAAAEAPAEGAPAGLELLDSLDADERIARDHRLPAVRAHLLEMAGDEPAARDHYEAAALLTTSIQQQRYLRGRAARLGRRA